MSETPFRLQSHVDFLYDTKPRRLPFQAQNQAEFKQWQQEMRATLVELLGLTGRPAPAKVEAQLLQSHPREGYTEEKYALDVGEGVTAPMYVLVPDGPRPYKPIMIFHGHNPSVQYILGNYPTPEEAAEWRAVDNNYAQVLAQAGYLVCAVEQRGFGERISDGTYGADRSCRHLAFEYMMQGRTLVGERCWDGMCAITYIQSRDDVLPDRLGCTGNSGGGTTTLWLSAIDPRITVVVPSCYLCSFKHSILGMVHCECNYVPNILEYAEMGDIAAAIAPRPFRAIAGEADPIFPIEGVRQQFETIQQAYTLHGVPEQSSLTVHPGQHAYNHEMSRAWFDRWL